MLTLMNASLTPMHVKPGTQESILASQKLRASSLTLRNKFCAMHIFLGRQETCRQRSWSASNWSNPTRCPRRSSSPQISALKSPNTAAASVATSEPSSFTKRRLCTVMATARSVWPDQWVLCVSLSAAGNVIHFYVWRCIWTQRRPANHHISFCVFSIF